MESLPEVHEYLAELGLEDDGEGDDEARREHVEYPRDRRELQEEGRGIEDRQDEGAFDQLYGLGLHHDLVGLIDEIGQEEDIEGGPYICGEELA